VRYRLRYADGSHNAEALLVDPRSDRLYVATKEEAGGGLYRAPSPLRTDQVNVLHRVARVPPVITDGAFAPNGRLFVLRDYQGAYVYRASGRRVGSFELPLQFQGESITVTADGRSVLAGSEGPESEVWRVPLPESALAQVTPTTRPPPTTSAPTTPATRDRAATPFLVAAAALTLVIGVGVLVTRRRS
jgi:hypothetical protein